MIQFYFPTIKGARMNFQKNWKLEIPYLITKKSYY